jgi:hypothetical protein
MTTRLRNLLTGGLFGAGALATVTALTAAAVGPSGPSADGPAAFERLKALEGRWQTAGPEGKKAVTVFELTANGTVLVERYAKAAMPGGGHMMTAYHLDGGDLILTHYCIAQNQPTLRADRYDATTGEVQFEFVRASNLASPAAGHMRRAKYVLHGRDRFTTEWEFFEGGRKTMTETEVFTRVK